MYVYLFIKESAAAYFYPKCCFIELLCSNFKIPGSFSRFFNFINKLFINEGAHASVLHFLVAICVSKAVFVTLNGTQGGRTNKRFWTAITK